MVKVIVFGSLGIASSVAFTVIVFGSLGIASSVAFTGTYAQHTTVQNLKATALGNHVYMFYKAMGEYQLHVNPEAVHARFCSLNSMIIKP